MEQNQPKKRGRKKKVKIEEIKPILPIPEPTEPKSVEKPEIKITPKNRISKEQLTQKLNLAVQELDEALKPDNIVDTIQKKIISKVIINRKSDQDFSQKYMQIYQKVKTSMASKEELQLWQSSISLEMAKNMCVIISFLLQNGPLNQFESSILENALFALKSYYDEQTYLISINREKYLNTTYMPSKNSEIYKFLIEVIRIPFLLENFSCF